MHAAARCPPSVTHSVSTRKVAPPSAISSVTMRYVEVGGVRISAIGLGCWQFGSMEWGYGKEYLEKDAIEIVHRALDLGVTLIDTAEIYGFGKSERAVGRALEGRRDEAFIANKGFPGHPIAPTVDQRGRGRERPPDDDTTHASQTPP